MADKIQQLLQRLDIQKEDQEAFLMLGVILNFTLFMLLGVLVGRTIAMI